MSVALERALVCAAPFATWLAFLTLLEPSAAGYAARSLATAAVGGVCLWRARRIFPELKAGRGWFRVADGGWALAVGLIVCALWILPETSEFYRTWCVTPLGEHVPATGPSPYDPAVCGVPLTLAKLLGSAFVIAPAEEVFFRYFVYRRLQARDFAAVDGRHFDLSAFLWTVALFALGHDRLVVGAMAGAFYALVAIRRGLVAAILSHVVTNLALAIWVWMRGEWGFW